jgi:membrane protein implicated in regulation of membrane protease activity
MITDEQFDALVSASDALAKTEPERYLRKMRGLLLLGDLYLAALTMVLLGLQIGALALIIRELYSTGAPSWQTLLALPVLLWALWFLRKLFLMPSGRKASTGSAQNRGPGAVRPD